MAKKTDIKTKLCVLYATGLGTGYSPFAPGTVGTLLAILLVYLFDYFSLPWLYISATVIIFFTGVYASTIAEKHFRRKDPGHVNIDEIAGYLAFMFFLPFNWKTVIPGFFIFRVMDIIKIPPTKLFEKFSGGWGIMLDDLIAAGYTLLIMIGISIIL
jgi:phosphatidylglycerophosphatase A